MAEPAPRPTEPPATPPVLPSLKAAERARAILAVQTASKPGRMKAFSLSAGLLAGLLIKRPRVKRGGRSH